jgi:hypothetical protein
MNELQLKELDENLSIRLREIKENKWRELGEKLLLRLERPAYRTSDETFSWSGWSLGIGLALLILSWILGKSDWGYIGFSIITFGFGVYKGDEHGFTQGYRELSESITHGTNGLIVLNFMQDIKSALSDPSSTKE